MRWCIVPEHREMEQNWCTFPAAALKHCNLLQENDFGRKVEFSDSLARRVQSS
jgi:hypothetical protein